MALRAVWISVAAALATALLISITWYDASHLSMRECQDQEADDYPWLEQVSQSTVGAVADRTRRLSFCDDAVLPGATVRVSVYRWTSRQQAYRHLRASQLLVERDGGEPRAGGAVVGVSRALDHLENDGRPFVTVSFSTPR